MYIHPLHALATSKGISKGEGCSCAFCGTSPFDWANQLGYLSDAVVAFRINYSVDSVCVGCKTLLGGRPGQKPIPLRMSNIFWVGDTIEYPDRKRMREIVDNPPRKRFILSWATSKKKHHYLNAGWSNHRQQLVGSDNYQIILTRKHVGLLSVLDKLVSFHGRKEVKSGTYNPVAIHRQGICNWSVLEEQVSEFRERPEFVFMVFLASPNQEETGENEMSISDTDRKAASVLELLATTSSVRRQNGLSFWEGFFRRRIEKHAHRNLPDFVSHLLDECGCSTTRKPTQKLMRIVANCDEDLMLAIRSRSSFLLSVAYGSIREKVRKKNGNTSPNKS